MSIPPFVYLVQGQAERIREYLHLADNPRADAIFLTYDEQLDGATFFPNSTWSEGRNKLLAMALEQGPYEYYLFSDDDAEFDEGNWTDLEDRVLEHQPAIGIPVFPKTRATPVPGLRTQPFRASDEQVMCVHHDVIEDNLIFPYQSQFDSLHWWAACQIQKILMQTFYRDGLIQFNDIRVRNECRVRYDNPDEGRETFERAIREWLDTQLVGGFRDFSYWTGRFHWRTWRTIVGHRVRTLLRRGGTSHHVSPQLADERLAPDSVLRTQYRGSNRIARAKAPGATALARGAASPAPRTGKAETCPPGRSA